MQLRLWKMCIVSILASSALGLTGARAASSDVPPAHQSICRQLQRDASRVRIARAAASTDRGEIPTLCFEGCRPDQIPADRFWGALDTLEKQAIHDELVQFSGYTASVTELEVGAVSGHVIRISGTVGTAGCLRDTYLWANADGYAPVISPSLASLSAEGRSCGAGEVRFSSMGNRHYVLDTHYDTFTVYGVDERLALTKLCAIPSDDSFSSDDPTLQGLPHRIDAAIRKRHARVSASCRLVGKPLTLGASGRYLVASVGRSCPAKKLTNRVWIVRDGPSPTIVHAGLAGRIQALDETHHGVRDVFWWLDRQHSGRLRFDGNRFVSE